MLTKILLTALVVLAAYLFIRYQRGAAASRPAPQEAAQPVPQTGIRRLAALLLVVFVVAAGAFFIYRWYDDRTLLTVRVINGSTGEVASYQAYKGDLEGRSFITIYGQAVSIADNERMEVQVAP